MVRLNLSLNNVRNCEEATKFKNDFEKIMKCKKKGIVNLAYKQGLLFEKFKEIDKFKELYKENDVSKTRKSVRKVSETQSGYEFK